MKKLYSLFKENSIRLFKSIKNESDLDEPDEPTFVTHKSEVEKELPSFWTEMD